MLETPHVALGAAIAMKIGNPYLAIPLALSSHFLLEKIPHWNPHLNTEMKKYGHLTNKTKLIIAVDTTLALGLGIFIAFKALPDSSLSLLVIASSFAAIVPDLLESPYFIFGVKNKIEIFDLEKGKITHFLKSPVSGRLNYRRYVNLSQKGDLVAAVAELKEI